MLTTCRRIIDVPLEPIKGSEFYTGAVLVDPAEYAKIPLIQSPLVGARISDKNVLLAEYVISMPGVGDQGQTGSCTAWATAYAARSALYHKATQLSYNDGTGNIDANIVFSPAYVWNSLNGGQNKGIPVPSAMELMQREGVATWREMPWNYNSVPFPSDAQKKSAAFFKIKNWGRIKVDITTIRQFLFFDIPVVIVIKTDVNFREPTVRSPRGDFMWTQFDPSTHNGSVLHGTHAITIMGYSASLNAFKLQNSWGVTQSRGSRTWLGKDGKLGTGFIWMDYNLLNTVVSEAYVMLSDDRDKTLPFVETIGVDNITASTATLKGSIKTLGDTPIQQYGFLAANDSTLLQFDYKPDTDSYSVKPGASLHGLNQTLKPPQSFSATDQHSTTAKRYFRAFGRSYNGVYYGQIVRFEPPKEPDPIPNNTELTPVATSTGDPHLKTFDRTGYSFQAVGEFTAVRSTATGNNFEIQVRQEPQPGSTQVSLNTGLAVRMNSDVLCVYPNRIYLNGRNLGVVTDERSLPSGGRLIGSSGRLTVQTAQGDQVAIRFFDTSLDYDLTMAPARRGQVTGLFGNYDGNGNNDLLRGDNGQSIRNEFAELYPNYANSWRIKQSESLFIYDVGKNTETYTDLSFPREPVNLTAQQRTAAEAVCRAAGVTDPQALNNCIVDVALTNNRQFADRALDFQLTTSALNAFSIGEFSTSDVQLEYYKASTANRAAILDTRNGAPSIVLMKQGVNIRRGFSTEFSFSTAELDQSSCFYLALWPTDAKTRSNNQNRVGFCFGFMDGMPTAFGQLNLNSGITITGKKQVANFVDGKVHKVRIAERSEPTNTGRLHWFVDVFLDDLKTPVYSYSSPTSTADFINASDGVGYIEFQINEGSPSRVQLFNWQYNTL